MIMNFRQELALLVTEFLYFCHLSWTVFNNEFTAKLKSVL